MLPTRDVVRNLYALMRCQNSKIAYLFKKDGQKLIKLQGETEKSTISERY